LRYAALRLGDEVFELGRLLRQVRQVRQQRLQGGVELLPPTDELGKRLSGHDLFLSSLRMRRLVFLWDTMGLPPSPPGEGRALRRGACAKFLGLEISGAATAPNFSALRFSAQ
jgi:hypothetical protein